MLKEKHFQLLNLSPPKAEMGIRMNKKNIGSTVIGYDLNDTYAQISYLSIGEAEPETASLVLGGDQYNIPTAIRQRFGTNLWLHGKDALKSDISEAPVFTRLLDLAIKGDALTAGEEKIDPVALLALFVKRSLSILTMQVNSNHIAAFMFTTPRVTPRVVEIIGQIAINLDLPPERVYVQSYRESIYQYVVHQPKELWNHHVLLFDYNSHMKAFHMESNKKTTPTVVFIEDENFPALQYTSGPSEQSKIEWDKQFLKIAEEVIKAQMISSIYLVGEGFKDEWANDSLKYLCRGRRVFRGNNLYGKGACYGAMEKIKPTKISETMVFLGEDKLKANIGLRLLRNGLESYFAVLDAGANWYECHNSFEVILDNRPELCFLITSLTGGHVSERRIALEGLPERPFRTTRLNLEIHLESADTALLTITDLGFGELFPASGKEWVKDIAL